MSDAAPVPGGRPRTPRTRRAVKRLATTAFRKMESAGVHVLPRHFYSPVADRRWLMANASSWQVPAPLTGVHWDLDEQLRWVEGVCRDHIGEVAQFRFLKELADRDIPFRYGLVEAQILHSFVRTEQPGRIVEVGSGASTALMAAAVRANAAAGSGSAPIVAVDPYAAEAVVALDGVEVVRTSALQVDGSLFASLGAGDLLFIDSSHAVKTGSELARLYLQVIPRLQAGVVIHIHDTYLPYLYSPWVLEDLWDWQETTLLVALLTNNEHLGVLCAQAALHHERPEELREILPDYRPFPVRNGIAVAGGAGHFPSSTWLVTR